MKNKLNRILSLVMALVMLVCTLPMTAAAAQSDFEIFQDRLLHYYGSDSAVVIPDGVTGINTHAFMGNANITSVVIPDSVTRIENSAFENCTSLTKVVIPNSVTEIKGSTFKGCTSLTEIVIPDSVTKIDAFAFQGCTSLTEIVIPDSVTSIGMFAFQDCTSLTEIVIPDSVTEIGLWAFRDCTSLTSVTVSENTACASTYVFQGCVNLKTPVKAPVPVTLTAPISAPVTAEAGTETKTEPAAQVFKDVAPDSPYYEAINTLGASGLFLGDGNGNFNPDNTITYGEFAVLLCRVYGIPIEEHYLHYDAHWGRTCDGTFSWACAAIQTTSSLRKTVDGSLSDTGGLGLLTWWNCFDANELMNRGETTRYVMGMWGSLHPELTNDIDLWLRCNPDGDTLYTVEKYEYQAQVDFGPGIGVRTITKNGARIIGVADENFSDMPSPWGTCVENHNWAVDVIAALYKLGIVHSDASGYFNPRENITRGELCQWLYNAGVTEPHCVKQFVA